MQFIDVKPCEIVPSIKLAIPASRYRPAKDPEEQAKKCGYWFPLETFIMARIMTGPSPCPCPQGSQGSPDSQGSQDSQGDPDDDEIMEVNTFVDVGSYTGYFCMVALALGHKVIAIDANDSYNSIVNASVQANGFPVKDILLLNRLISDSTQPVPFDGITTHRRIINTGSAKLTNTTSLADIIPKGCRLLKIDVSGSEPEVLNSASRLITSGTPVTSGTSVTSGTPATSATIPYIIVKVPFVIDRRFDPSQIGMLVKLIQCGYVLYNMILPATTTPNTTTYTTTPATASATASTTSYNTTSYNTTTYAYNTLVKVEDLDKYLGILFQQYKDGKHIGVIKVLAVHQSEPDPVHLFAS